eukprot:scaffold97036_cov16-Tisochrysis_lutea.AAC.2
MPARIFQANAKLTGLQHQIGTAQQDATLVKQQLAASQWHAQADFWLDDTEQPAVSVIAATRIEHCFSQAWTPISFFYPFTAIKKEQFQSDLKADFAQAKEAANQYQIALAKAEASKDQTAHEVTQ